MPETQRRKCEGGAWSEWSGDFAAEACTRRGVTDCDGTPSGGMQSRTRYVNLVANPGQECTSEIQTRTCGDGAWSDWTGSYTELTCEVRDAASCGNVPHGGRRSQVRYAELEVGFTDECVSETQEQTCNDGQWTAWTGTFAHATCRVRDARSCGDQSHGSSESRVKFADELVDFGGTCESEEQRRTCSDGEWTVWTGTFTHDTCDPRPGLPCGERPHGSSESQLRFAESTVPFGSTCQGETQRRTCFNGVWSEFSGSFVFLNCTVDPPSSCGEAEHGDEQTRVRYRRSSEPFDSTCLEQEQSRTCSNGDWSSWTGSFEAEECVVCDEGDAACEPPGTQLCRSVQAQHLVDLGEVASEGMFSNLAERALSWLFARIHDYEAWGHLTPETCTTPSLSSSTVCERLQSQHFIDLTRLTRSSSLTSNHAEEADRRFGMRVNHYSDWGLLPDPCGLPAVDESLLCKGIQNQYRVELVELTREDVASNIAEAAANRFAQRMQDTASRGYVAEPTACELPTIQGDELCSRLQVRLLDDLATQRASGPFDNLTLRAQSEFTKRVGDHTSHGLVTSPCELPDVASDALCARLQQEFLSDLTTLARGAEDVSSNSLAQAALTRFNRRVQDYENSEYLETSSCPLPDVP